LQTTDSTASSWTTTGSLFEFLVLTATQSGGCVAHPPTRQSPRNRSCTMRSLVASAPQRDDDAGGELRSEDDVVAARQDWQIGGQTERESPPEVHVHADPRLHDEPGPALFVELGVRHVEARMDQHAVGVASALGVRRLGVDRRGPIVVPPETGRQAVGAWQCRSYASSVSSRLPSVHG